VSGDCRRTSICNGRDGFSRQNGSTAATSAVVDDDDAADDEEEEEEDAAAPSSCHRRPWTMMSSDFANVSKINASIF
jgi:hypothetical protein